MNIISIIITGVVLVAFSAVVTAAICAAVFQARTIALDSEFPTDPEIETATDNEIVTWAFSLPPAETEYQTKQLNKVKMRYMGLPNAAELADKFLAAFNQGNTRCPNCGKVHPPVAEFGYSGKFATVIYGNNPTF